MRKLFTILMLVLTITSPVLAVEPDEVLKDPVLEARARDLSANLRRLVCQNQSIDDSNAPLAKDLRILLRERLVAGDTNQEVVDYLVGRFGEFVLLKPLFTGHTLILWLGPFVVLLLGIIAIFRFRKNATRKAATEDELSEDEKQKLAQLLDGE